MKHVIICLYPTDAVSDELQRDGHVCAHMHECVCVSINKKHTHTCAMSFYPSGRGEEGGVYKVLV